MPFTAIHSKAIFLLIVFSLNTVVSFACSLGGLFHSFHHHTNAAATVKTHGHHQQKEGHHNDHGSTSHHQEEQPDKPADDCCSQNVVQLDKAEKATSRVIEAPGVIFLTSFLLSYTSFFSPLPQERTLDYAALIRWRLPATIQDLRIVIQSFQI